MTTRLSSEDETEVTQACHGASDISSYSTGKSVAGVSLSSFCSLYPDLVSGDNSPTTCVAIYAFMSGQIYVGYWIDWSYGPISGARLTIPSETAGFLIAFIAIFSGWVGTAVWNLVAFTVHQWRCTVQPRDGLYHQLQSALCNNTTHISFAITASRIGYAWRNHATQALGRAGALSSVAVMIGVLFAATGTFSARIASSNGSVLLTGTTCGFPAGIAALGLDSVALTLGESMQSGVTLTLSNAYAQDCYVNPVSGNSSIQYLVSGDATTCTGYARPSLGYNVTTGVACPFEEACSVDASQVLQLDTGFLDSNDDLGINQPFENRVLFRRLTTCSPLQTAGFSDNKFSHIAGYEYLGNVSTYAYGRNSYQPTRFAFTQPVPYSNTTFLYTQNTYTASETAYYLMIATTMQHGSSGPVFTPIPDISPDPRRPMSLIFLANRAFYQDSVDDAWFNASRPLNRSANRGTLSTYYLSDYPGSVLGCIEQAQICTADMQNCTHLDDWHTWKGFLSYYTGIDEANLTAIGLNDIQKTTALMIQEAALSGLVWNIIDQLGPKALLASSYLSQQEFFYSPALPNTQWQREVANWFSIGLAQLQRSLAVSHRRPIAPILQQYWQNFPANATAIRSFCDSQKVHDARFTTFNVLGLGIALSLGLLILICGHGAPFFVPKIQRKFASRRQQRSIPRDQWIASHHLHLQRMVFQLTGQGSWSGEEDSVPVTAHREMLEPLPLFIEKSNPDGDLLPYQSRTIQPMQHWEQRDVLKSPAIESAETRSTSEER